MCHTDDSRPPAPPRTGHAGAARRLHLTGPDGARFMAYHALTTVPDAPAAVILPDLRGLHEFYVQFADRLADAGVEALVVDYYGRELLDGPRTATAEEMFPLVMALPPDQVAGDIAAAAAHLRGGGSRPVFSLGFCFGGSQSWIQSALDPDLAGCIGFYGRPAECRPYVGDMQVPLLLLVAGADAFTPAAEFERFAAELADAGVDHEMTVYAGAPHSFFDGAAGHPEACDDAWRRVLDFVTARAHA